MIGRTVFDDPEGNDITPFYGSFNAIGASPEATLCAAILNRAIEDGRSAGRKSERDELIVFGRSWMFDMIAGMLQISTPVLRQMFFEAIRA